MLAAAATGALLSGCGTNNIAPDFFTPTVTAIASATPTATPDQGAARHADGSATRMSRGLPKGPNLSPRRAP